MMINYDNHQNLIWGGQKSNGCLGESSLGKYSCGVDQDLDDDHAAKISSSSNSSIITSNNSNCIINFDENKTQDKVVYFN